MHSNTCTHISHHPFPPSFPTLLPPPHTHSLRVYDMRSCELRHVLKGHTAWINDVALTEGGALCATASGEPVCRVYDLARGECVRLLEGHSAEIHSVAMTRRGRFVVTGSEDGTARVWDLHAARRPPVPRHAGAVHAALATADGARVVTAGAWEGMFGDCVCVCVCVGQVCAHCCASCGIDTHGPQRLVTHQHPLVIHTLQYTHSTNKQANTHTHTQGRMVPFACGMRTLVSSLGAWSMGAQSSGWPSPTMGHWQ